MCLHARDLPCEGIIGKVAAPASALIDLDDTGSQHQQHTQLFLDVLLHNGIRRGISAIILDYHLGGDG
jgi:hypothetical protein